MSRATGIINRVNSVMRKVAPLTRTCYKRTVTRTGGNDLIGRPGTSTNTDTLLDPQPVYQAVGRQPISGGRDTVQPLMTAAGRRTADDYEFTVTPTALSLAELQAKNLLLVFKDAAGAEEVLDILDFEPIGLENTVVAIIIMARSIKRA